jgi:type I restriction enzyme R subunit
VPLSEADTRAKLIDPALHARGWTEDLIRREETAGAVEIINGKPRRRAKGRTDYTLRVKVNREAQPVAVGVIEAKAENLPPTHGLEQAKLYASCERLNVPFVFSSNGHLFVEFDHSTGLTTSPRPLTAFPGPTDLRARYEHCMGFSLADPEAQPLLARYTGGEATRRYYQDAAIRAALEKIARCKKTGEPPRALLSLATGAGKTFIAVQLLKRFADAGQLRRALFVCDRDELRSQAIGAFQNLFGADAAPVSAGNPQKNARVLIATYQTLDVASDEADAKFLATHYPADYFSHIVIDECHRSAWGKWSEVLTRNPNSVQVGLTATPRQLEISEKSKEALADSQVTADNLRYFGEPVYQYDMGQGIDDGYLAACEIQKGRVNLDETGISFEEVLKRHPTDALTGEPVSADELRELYEKTSFEDRILLPDRVLAMCADLFDYLVATGGPEQKTIIFCVRDRHADDVAITLNNLYAHWCAANGRPRLEPYAFKCTASVGGADYIADLKAASRSRPGPGTGARGAGLVAPDRLPGRRRRGPLRRGPGRIPALARPALSYDPRRLAGRGRHAARPGPRRGAARADARHPGGPGGRLATLARLCPGGRRHRSSRAGRAGPAGMGGTPRGRDRPNRAPGRRRAVRTIPAPVGRGPGIGPRPHRRGGRGRAGEPRRVGLAWG